MLTRHHLTPAHVCGHPHANWAQLLQCSQSGMQMYSVCDWAVTHTDNCKWVMLYDMFAMNKMLFWNLNWQNNTPVYCAHPNVSASPFWRKSTRGWSSTEINAMELFFDGFWVIFDGSYDMQIFNLHPKADE